MSKTRRKRTEPLTINELAEYMASKTIERLSQLPPDERKVREAAFQKIIAEVRAKRGRRPRTRGSRVPSRSR